MGVLGFVNHKLCISIPNLSFNTTYGNNTRLFYEYIVI